MASGGRLLGLQLPHVPYLLHDFMPTCVRSAHNSDANECSSSSSSMGLLALSPKFSNVKQSQALESHLSSTLNSNTNEDVEVEKVTTKNQNNVKQKPDLLPSPTSKCMLFENNSSIVEGDCSPTLHTKEAGENINLQSCGLRSKLSSMLSLEKRVSIPDLPLVIGHSSQFMMESLGFQSTRQVSKVDSKICPPIQKESCARMFDLYDDKNFITFVPSYSTASSGYVGTSLDASNMEVKHDLSWIDGKCNDAWGIEPWHSDQHNILMKTLHIMRCDIEALKMMLQSLDLPASRGGPFNSHLHDTLNCTPYMHSVRMKSSSTMSKIKHDICQPSNDEQTKDKELFFEERKELVQIAENTCNVEATQELCTLEKSPSKKEEKNEETISVRSHGCAKKRKQWWKEILAAFGLTIWVITGAVLVAKAIGVPNLGVSNNVAYNGFWGRSDDEEAKTPISKSESKRGLGVVELTAATFNETIKRRPTFVMFYAPWCPHCQRLHPVWAQLASVLNKKEYNVQLAIVDATKYTKLADKYDVLGFPTLIMFKNNMPIGRHQGARNMDTLMSFIDNNSVDEEVDNK